MHHLLRAFILNKVAEVERRASVRRQAGGNFKAPIFIQHSSHSLRSHLSL